MRDDLLRRAAAILAEAEALARTPEGGVVPFPRERIVRIRRQSQPGHGRLGVLVPVRG